MSTDEYPLGLYPTPLQRFKLPPELLGHTTLLVKRDDLCGVGFGGNKIRKLRLLLQDALQQGATTVLTWGGPQSNHCALTAGAAALAGLKCELFFNADPPETVSGNQRVNVLLGAERHFLGPADEAQVMVAMQERAGQLKNAGEQPYLIPLGGSNPLGVLAYAHAVKELLDQLPPDERPERLVVAGGSLGTLAGLILGTWVYGLPCQVDGYSVLWRQDVGLVRLNQLLERTRAELFPEVTSSDNFHFSDEQLGDGYGRPTAEGQAAARHAAQYCGLMLEQTYTAKAFAGLLAAARAGRYREGERVLYWHTGGTGGFFA